MITVFTPTYNRCHLIDRLYKSLLVQTVKDFEWIVVDDGSTDDTEKYFETILRIDNPFKIIYYKQTNGGKHRAINAGVRLANGKLFFIVDSDDYILNDAIEKLDKWCKSLDDSKKWAGVAGLRGYSEDICIGGAGKNKPFIDAKNTERNKYNLAGDKAEAYFTSVLREYPFPEFAGEKFITEEAVWNDIASDGYYIRWYNDIIYIGEYLAGGLTRSNNLRFGQNPQGVLYWAKVQIKAYPKNLLKKMSAVSRYYKEVYDCKKISDIAKDIGLSTAFCRLTIFIAKIVGR